MTTRREVLGMASVGVVAVAIAGRIALVPRASKPTPGNFPVEHSEADWRAELSPASYHVLREGSTEKPFSSPLVEEHRKGLFACAGCDLPRFSSDTKYDSKTGWPSFWQALPNAVSQRADNNFGMVRTEILCSNCGGHLGHVFDDGPKPTGLRYCMNGIALAFKPAADA